MASRTRAGLAHPAASRPAAPGFVRPPAGQGGPALILDSFANGGRWQLATYDRPFELGSQSESNPRFLYSPKRRCRHALVPLSGSVLNSLTLLPTSSGGGGWLARLSEPVWQEAFKTALSQDLVGNSEEMDGDCCRNRARKETADHYSEATLKGRIQPGA